MAPVTAESGEFDYDSISPGYYDLAIRRNKGVQAKWHRIEFAHVLAEIGDAAPLLDVGCGPGTFLGSLDGARTCVGLDVAQAQVDYARREYGTPARTFEVFGGGPLPVGDASFAAVTMVQVVEHLADPLPALREAVRALRPGGRLVVTTPNYASHWPVLEWLVGKLSPVDYAHQHISKFRPALLGETLRRAGLEDVKVRTYMRLAPFAAALSWGFADAVERLERRVPLLPGALILGTGTRPN